MDKRSDPSGSLFELENSYEANLICGLDEVGRAPLAGPVTAACVVIPKESRSCDFWTDVTDSKLVSRQKRERLYELICENSFYGLGWVGPREIERMNIHVASLVAMQRAYQEMCGLLKATPAMALADGRFAPDLGIECRTIVKGDLKCKSIAAASIIAKRCRDAYMGELHQQFPVYNWTNNVGYPTKDHLEALTNAGPCPFHRRTFARVREFFEIKKQASLL